MDRDEAPEGTGLPRGTGQAIGRVYDVPADTMPPPDSATVLIAHDHLQRRIGELAREIERGAADSLHLICVLNGAFVFLADLIRAMTVPVTVDFIAVSSYVEQTSSGEIQLLKDLEFAIEGRDVVIIEDIVDTGLTLLYLQDVLRARRPRSLRTACLLNKPSRRRVEVTVDHVGFTIGDTFVVGFGLDVDQQLRQLPYIATLPSTDH